MNLHNLVSSLVAFLLLAAFGAIVFALAHFASHGTFSPNVEDDAAREETAPEEATPDEATAPVQPAAHTHDMPSSLDS